MRFLRRALVLRLFSEIQRGETELLSDTVGFVFHLGIDTLRKAQFLACKRINGTDDNMAVHRLCIRVRGNNTLTVGEQNLCHFFRIKVCGERISFVLSARRKLEMIIFSFAALFAFSESFHRILKLICKVFVLKQISDGDILCLVRIGDVIERLAGGAFTCDSFEQRHNLSPIAESKER